MDCFIIFIIIIIIIYVILRISINNKNHSINNNEDNISELNNTNYYNHSNEDNISELNNTNYYNHSSDDYYEFEDKHYDKIQNKLDSYNEYCEDTGVFFESNFNINQRIKKLQTCINKMDSIRNFYYNLGENGKKLFNKETSDYFANWSKNDIIINTNADKYCFEFDKIRFQNYNFLTYLLKLYTDDTETQKKHLQQEEKYYRISELGETESSTEEDETKEYLTSIKKTIIKLLTSSDNIMQSKLINEFTDDDKYYVRKVLKEMEANNEISKEKQGRTYIITYKNSTNENKIKKETPDETDLQMINETENAPECHEFTRESDIKRD